MGWGGFIRIRYLRIYVRFRKSIKSYLEDRSKDLKEKWQGEKVKRAGGGNPGIYWMGVPFKGGRGKKTENREWENT